LEELRIANIGVIHTPDPSVRAGLTGASAALAETGSLLLCGGSECSLTASLLPELHIAIIHEEDILDSLPQVLNLEEVRDASVAVIITGPSRTADIEMTLTIGVHGPGEVYVFCPYG
jgi:L-lactate dehydrogenase complex protein LldG